MKRALRVILPVFLALLIIVCTFWYLFVYDRAFVRDVLLSAARHSESRGNLNISTWFYNRAYDLADKSDTSGESVIIELSEQYKRAGNYTKAEYTLANAISNGGGVDVYVALCKTYLEQNKVYDAVNMLNGIKDPQIKAEIESMRPAAPVLTPEPNFYKQYIPVSIEAEFGTIYASADGKYPNIQGPAYTKPFTLQDGENKVLAVAVSENGLVSPLTTGTYTITGVIKEVTFVDEQVEAAVRQQISGSATKQLYTSDLWKITEFTVPADAQSYEDLQHMIFLTTLTIENGKSEDFAFLAKLTNLQELSITETNLSKETLTIIGGLSNLEKLTLEKCAISNASPISNLPNLKELSLRENYIVDISALSTLSGLQKLDLSSNMALESIVPVTNLTSLTWLDASHNALSDITGIGNLKNLTYLSLASNKLTDVSELAQCTKLEKLNISSNKISDISGLSALNNLIYLFFADNKVTQLPAFSETAKLATIDGSNNYIQSLDSLVGLESLNNVFMDGNTQIASVNELSACHNLIEVRIENTMVTDVSALTAMNVIVKPEALTQQIKDTLGQE